MANRQKTRKQKINDKAYRDFLTKFMERPSFDHVSISNGLNHVYKTTFKQDSSPSKSLIKSLVETITTNKDKVLRDMKNLKECEDMAIEPLSFDDLLLANSEYKVTRSNKRNRDEDLTNNGYKKEKFSGKSEEVTRAKFNVKTRKRKNICNIRRKNSNMLNYINLQKSSSTKHTEKKTSTPKVKNIIKGPFVVIEKNPQIQELAKCLNFDKDTFDEARNEVSNEGNTNYKEVIDEINEDSYNGESEGDVNLNKSNVLDKSNNRNSSLEVIQNLSHSNENNDNTINNPLHTYVKQESDLFEMSIQSENSFNVSQCSEQPVEIPDSSNNSMSTTLNLQENVSSCKFAYYNNLMSPIQMFNNVEFLQNPTFLPYTVMPIQQFNPNIMFIDPSGFNNFQGMFNNPSSQFGVMIPQNLCYSVPQPQQLHQLFSANQIYNPSQEVIKLQSAVINVNAQFSMLQNWLATQNINTTNSN